MDSQAWRIAAASAIGTSHLKSQLPCQDAFAYDAIDVENGVVLLVASDGAGSASRSDRGSALACNELVDSVRSFFDDGGTVSTISRENALGWLENASTRITAEAEQEQIPVREFACTLLVAIVSGQHACFLQVGDGAMVVRPRGDEWAYVFWPQHGEYINTTVFLTDQASMANFEFSCGNAQIDEVAVFTDGIEALVLNYADRAVHGPFFDTVIQPVRALPDPGHDHQLSEQLKFYLESPVFCDRTDDDKTLLLASRLPISPLPSESEVN